MATRRSLAAKRYAEAIAVIAGPAASWDAWLEDLGIVAAAVADPGARAILSDPARSDVVARFIDAPALRAGLREETRQLLRVMAHRRATGLLPDVLEWFRELVDDARGIRRVTVTSAVALDADQLRRVRDSVAGPGSDPAGVVLTLDVDPEIIGGLVIREGDRIRDVSVRARLETLRERMS